MANPTMTLISSQTLGGTTASVTFSSIPSTYNDLKLVYSARTDATPNVYSYNYVTFNNDTTTKYSATVLQGNGGSASSSRETNATDSGNNDPVINSSGGLANTFSTSEIYIPNYNSTGTKPFTLFSAQEANSSTAYMTFEAEQYRGTSGISSIKLTPSLANFVQYSDFYLYGIKNS